MLIHTEDPERDTVDVLERYKGELLVSRGMDGCMEMFDDSGCDTMEREESMSIGIHMS